MKCIILMAVTLLIASVNAQEFLTGNATKILEKHTPVSVVAAVQTDFPNLAVLEYYRFPAEKIDVEWTVADEDSLRPEVTTDYYTVVLKGKRGGYVYSLYNGNG